MKGSLSTIKGRTQHRVVSDWVLMQAYFDNNNTLMLCFADRHSTDQAVFNLEEEDIQRLSKLLASANRIAATPSALRLDSLTPSPGAQIWLPVSRSGSATLSLALPPKSLRSNWLA
jgi:hypothetical protein